MINVGQSKIMNDLYLMNKWKNIKKFSSLKQIEPENNSLRSVILGLETHFDNLL